MAKIFSGLALFFWLVSCKNNPAPNSTESRAAGGAKAEKSLGVEVKALFAQYQKERGGEGDALGESEVNTYLDTLAREVAEQDADDVEAKLKSEAAAATVEGCQQADVAAGAVVIGLAAAMVIHQMVQEEVKYGRIGISPVRYDGRYYYVNELIGPMQWRKRLVLKVDGKITRATLHNDKTGLPVYLEEDLMRTMHYPVADVPAAGKPFVNLEGGIAVPGLKDGKLPLGLSEDQSKKHSAAVQLASGLGRLMQESSSVGITRS